MPRLTDLDDVLFPVEERPVFVGGNAAGERLLSGPDKKAIVDTRRSRVLGVVSRDLGENAYAVLNVITDFASHPPATRYVHRERNRLQQLAGTWLSKFAQRCILPEFNLDAYLAALTAPNVEVSSEPADIYGVP